MSGSAVDVAVLSTAASSEVMARAKKAPQKRQPLLFPVASSFVEESIERGGV